MNTSVIALDLSNNNISDVGILSLVQAIANNTTLRQLQLSYNQLSDAGAVALAEVSTCRAHDISSGTEQYGAQIKEL